MACEVELSVCCGIVLWLVVLFVGVVLWCVVGVDECGVVVCCGWFWVIGVIITVIEILR